METSATYVLTGHSTRTYAVLLWVLAAVALLSSWNYGFRNLVAMACVAASLSIIGWLCYWNPRVILDPSGVTIVNPAHTVHIPWLEVHTAESRWGLQITPIQGRTVHVWAIPGRAAVRETFGKRQVERPVTWTEHTGTEHLRVTAHRAAEIITIRSAELQATPHVTELAQQEPADARQTTVETHYLPLIIMAMLIVASIAIIVI